MSKATTIKSGFTVPAGLAVLALTTGAVLLDAGAGIEYTSPVPDHRHMAASDSQIRSRGKQKPSVRVEFSVDRNVGGELGFANASEAVMAFYRANEGAYQETDSNTELVAFLVRSSDRRIHVTTAARVSATFTIRAAMRLPRGWKRGEVIHTHPPRPFSQEGFSVEDRDAVLAGLPGYFVRTPLGDVRFIDKKLARKTRNPGGASGKSLCPAEQACLARHRGEA